MTTSHAADRRWHELGDRAQAGHLIDREEARAVVRAGPDRQLSLLDTAFTVRCAHHGRRVHLHLERNVLPVAR